MFSARTDKILGEELDASTRGLITDPVVDAVGAEPVAAVAVAATTAPVVDVAPVDVAIEKLIAPALTSKEVCVCVFVDGPWV